MTKAKLQEDLDLSSGNMSTLEKIADGNGGMEKEGSISSASTEVDSKMKELNSKLEKESGNMSTLEKIADGNGGMEKEGSISSASTDVDSKMKELNSKLEKESFADEFDSQLALSTLKMRAGEISEAYLLIGHDPNDALNGILLERLAEVDRNIHSCDQALSENDWPLLVERCDKALEEADLLPKLHVYKALGLLMLQNEKEAIMELHEAIFSLVKKFIGEEDLLIIEDLVKFREAISNASKEQCGSILEDEVEQLKQLDEEKADRAQCWRAVEKLYEPLIKEKMDRINILKGYRHQLYHQSSSVVEEELDPFSLVADELSLLSNKLRAMVVAKFPKLASAAEYFFKTGVEGKQFRPTILLLMATALNVRVPEALAAESADIVSSELRVRRGVAEITEMIHVASLLHDDVLDDADTRRGVGSINFVMDNKISVLAGDFLLSRACVALAALKNTEVVSLLATVVEHVVTGETMQMTSTTDQRHSMDYYMEKTYYKTASLISNSCKAIALLAGQSAEVAMLAFGYGKNLGLALQLIDDVLDFTGTSASLREGSLSDIKHGIITAPILFAMEEFPQLREVVDQLEKDPTSVGTALEYLEKSNGIQKTRELAIEHANRAAAAIGSLPETDDEDVKRSRRALIDLTHRVCRNK